MNSTSDRDSQSPPPADLLRGASLFLDFDGTLVGISETPDGVVVTTKLRDLLARLQEQLNGRVAVITGRSASSVEQLFEPMRILVGGSHGLEIPAESPGETAGGQVQRPECLDSVVDEFRELERKYPGVLVEEKPLGVALHYRQAPDAEQACRIASDAAAERTGLEIQAGKMVFELKARGGNKGDALRTLMSRPPFEGSRPLFLGDDLTDEPAFTAAHELGGAGVLIGEPRPSAAAYRLPSVSDALDWLGQASEGAE